MIEPTLVDRSSRAASLDKPVAVVGFLWAFFPSIAGAMGMVSAVSNYEALVHHHLGSFGPGTSTISLLSALDFLVWFPLTGLWFILVAVQFLTGPLTMRRLVVPIAAAAIVATVVAGAFARSRHTGIEFDPGVRLFTPYFWYSALISLGGVVAAWLSVWLFRRRPANVT